MMPGKHQIGIVAGETKGIVAFDLSINKFMQVFRATFGVTNRRWQKRVILTLLSVQQ